MKNNIKPAIICIYCREVIHNDMCFYDKSTKAYLPWELIYSEEVGDRESSREKEKFYKTAHGRRIIKKHIPTY